MATAQRQSAWMAVIAAQVGTGAEADDLLPTVGETEPLLPSQWAHALAQLERTEPLENAEWNHLDEGDQTWLAGQLDDGRPSSWPPT